jgi:hypothetical protein
MLKSNISPIAKEMSTQDNLGTQYPVWVVMEKFRGRDRPNLNSGMYFTQQACQTHIDENYYHYNNARPFAYSAWRNPELQMVMQFVLVEGGDQEVPSHYV